MMKLYLWLFIFTYSNLHAGLTDFYFKKSGISCETNGVKFSEGILGTNEQLVTCFSQNQITEGQLSEFENDTKNLRVDLETWIYIQNSSEKVLAESKQRKNEFKNYQALINANNTNPQIQKWKSTYTILRALYKQKEELEKQQKLCSRWRVWNVFERYMDGVDCAYIRSEEFEAILSATQLSIETNENLSPIFYHPDLQQSIKAERENFDADFRSFLTNSLTELDYKIRRHSVISKQPLSKKNLNSALNSPTILREINAVNYNPDGKIIRPYGDELKLISLSNAHCITRQKLIAHDSDELLKGFGKDVALLIAPFAIKGKINAVFKAVNSLRKTAAANNARKTLIATEGAIALAELKSTKEAKNKCESINSEIAKHIVAPQSLITQAKDCKDLLESMATSDALAVLGAAAAIKLSKYDITDIRLARVASKGKEKLQKSLGAIQATLVKQADLIAEQLDNLAGEPTLATVTTGIETGSRNTSGDLNQYSQQSSNTYVSTSNQDTIQTQRFNRRKARADAREQRKKTEQAKSEAKESSTQKQDNKNSNSSSNKPKVPEDMNLRVERAIEKLQCIKDKSCTETIGKLKDSIMAVALGPKGVKVVDDLFEIIKDSGYKNLPESYRLILNSCLSKGKTGKVLCSNFQLQALFKIIEHDTKPPLSFQGITRILKMVEFDAREIKVDRALNFFSDLNPNSKKGQINGEMHEIIENPDGSFLANGKTLTPDKISEIKGLELENEAFELLANLGFKIDILPNGKEERLLNKIQGKFEKIARKDNIATNRNPDLIINDNYIADIYSPLSGLNKKNLNLIVDRILNKSEGKNFKPLTNQVTEEGKRQTNRVMVYAHSVSGSFDDLIKKLRNLLQIQNPQHLEEATILIERNGKPELIRIWP